MRESTIILEGKVREFARSEAGNLAFMLEDSGGDIHYCFSPIKYASLGLSDDLIIHGSSHGANKIRLNYVLNKTRNTEDVLIESKQSWAYNVSLIFSILITAGFIIALLILLRIIPINYYSSYGYIFSSIFSFIMIIMLLPVLIIMWVLTSSFGKKRRESEELKEYIKIMKQNMGISTSVEPIAQKRQVKVQSEPYTAGTAKYCSHCGEKLPLEAKFCSKCGAMWEL